MDAYETLMDIVSSFHSGTPRGVFSVCSSHPPVVDATLATARDHGSTLLLESTSNQVNQFGGYTGMKPQDFFRWIRDRQRSVGIPDERVLIGGDHLGPFPWRNEPAAAAMDKARGLVRACVSAGYSKIHVDATICLADDRGNRGRPLDPRVSAERTAELCGVAETAWRELRSRHPDARPPLYVIGSDVPLPGGTPDGAIAPEVTKVEDLEESLALSRSALLKKGLDAAWERVIAVVVQPAVEHSARVIHPYVRERVGPLTTELRKIGNVVFEAHATDYQTPEALRQMVEDGFGILKLGPSLTSAFREAIFLLAHIEQILAPLTGLAPSRVPQALEAAMVSDPKHWKSYYEGSENELAFARLFGLSDRCRYYWNAPDVDRAVQQLTANLQSVEIPLSLLSQYFPRQYHQIRQGMIPAQPDALIRAQIAEVLASYKEAVTPRDE